MGDVWLEAVDSVLRPARPALDRCLAERARHLEARKRVNEERLRAISECERRIEQARASVFAASDGVVRMNMTDLEREWRKLSRVDPEAGLMDLWARVAPREWHDVKRWRNSPPVDRVDAAVALASDVAGVEDAEEAARALRTALAEQGVTAGARIAWRFFDHDRSHCGTMFRGPSPVHVLAPAREDVRTAALERFPDRPLLARDLAIAAAHATTPVAKALCRLWKTGYVLYGYDATTMTLEMPAV